MCKKVLSLPARPQTALTLTYSSMLFQFHSLRCLCWLELSAFQRSCGPRLSFVSIVLTRKGPEDARGRWKRRGASYNSF